MDGNKLSPSAPLKRPCDRGEDQYFERWPRLYQAPFIILTIPSRFESSCERRGEPMCRHTSLRESIMQELQRYVRYAFHDLGARDLSSERLQPYRRSYRKKQRIFAVWILGRLLRHPTPSPQSREPILTKIGQTVVSPLYTYYLGGWYIQMRSLRREAMKTLRKDFTIINSWINYEHTLAY